MTDSVRTEGDTWDITTSVGFTALLVAAARAVEADRADALARDPYARIFIEAAGDPRTQAMLNSAEGADGPLSASRHLGIRTKFFDDFVTDAVAAGIRQVVILASGLDTRGYRLDLPTDTVVYELDQPEVLAFKTETLAAHGATAAAGLHTVGIDLRENWPAALVGTGFDATAPSAWLAEGLLPYLPADAQALLFERIVELAAPGSRAAVEGQTGAFDLDGFRALQQKYATPDNPLGDFDVTSLFLADAEREDPADYLAGQGWTVRREGGPVELSERYGVGGAVLPDDAARLSGVIEYFTAELPRS
ncbi:S-adenosyl-L-methionine-dependent methyltransferase OS=Tsukamurella paurometabola (strain ATCC 8368/ DSM / CCUG 35730 / CIP 100753 / JCM 10117 / KCTC 9821/ NBRC 16120 / NCIMB 702349 / NCTC 13040) OX=521096 GN=Tpau_3841 PE=3 SV=1 [Tsukamurella paurometabola]|uniref:S-adenosyl-L-methionine-dependent methyltransferase n=1 Tax=Tsukamurella paurometabola (strain ATCC 8368 / DSM 20162 / CCUG 35730 / CIP 100753 / JCM 10117 / KCTC 9821 / NBRC 16120 / NCIMB 702349 / NCTC 13040) TaxID=521096 RepID=D5UYW3_TSUPD|nr:class I SAM-dependent methyltransferase [Tsukamurella paurometabola]ADG80416.1 methyltransferase [Tsukamurella paurometabola DSM 20162]SUP39557.1 Putative S-adenosyl-L-methionine-dependent methyltransferase ML2640 [Tsukamurella paurometabola]